MSKDTVSQAKAFKSPQDNVPRTKGDRNRLREAVEDYIAQNNPVPPLSVVELRAHAARVLDSLGMDSKYADFAAVLVSNAVWSNTVARIPYSKRLLLLPKCIRDSRACPAEFDEIGLLCQDCGRCPNGEFKKQAEQLGYAVLIAEGSPIVMSLVKTGKVDAIIGISCLSVLENVFPYMDAGAVPGIAIPLLRDGCCDTSVDVDWIWEAVYRTGESETSRMNLEQLREQVNSWFAPDSLVSLLGPARTHVQKVALDWLRAAGKRWRPFLSVAVYRAIAAGSNADIPADMKKIALAVECFHKASLVHDDIEDDDDLRYGQKTLHAEYGIPIALNVGDFLLGEGYRLLTELDIPSDRKVKMLAIASRGHLDLCLGQGNELSWVRQPRPLQPDEVIDIFRKKTSPAFEVALKLGALFAGDDGRVLGILEGYSDALGIAYQIRDDIEEFFGRTGADGAKSLRPSLLLALAHEEASPAQRAVIESVWKGASTSDCPRTDIRDILMDLAVPRTASNMMELYKSRALSCLAAMNIPDLKALLRRVIAKIFNEIDVMGCCNDYKAGHDNSRLRSEESAD
jgi:geranylgeranyl pyrophosphate synthase